MTIYQQEILENILSRLPAKSIGRFRRVSKEWKSLLSQSQFIKMHLNRIKQYPIVEQSLMLVSAQACSLYTAQLKYAHQVFDEMTTLATKLNLDGHEFESETFLDNIACCDGLVVVKDEDNSLLLMNPTTRELKEVPPYDPHQRYCDIRFGIGYDSLLDDYKIVALSYYNDGYYFDFGLDMSQSNNTEMFVNVYTVKDGTWKTAESSPYDHAVGPVTSGVLVNGYIHWLAIRTNELSSVVVAFNVKEEKFYEVPTPSSIDLEEFSFKRLAALGGCLCIFSFKRSYETDIWVMKEYGDEKSWTKFTIIDHENSEYRPLCLMGKEQVVLAKDEEYDGAKLVMYNKEEGTSNDIVIQGIPDGFGFGGTFLETLVSPHCNNEGTRQ